MEGYPRAREALERALILDAKLAQAHVAMGQVNTDYDWDWASADASYQRALALEPGNVNAMQGAADLARTLGRLEDCLTLARRAVEVDPLAIQAHADLARCAYYTGRHQEAISAYNKVLELNPQRTSAHAFKGTIYLLEGRPQEALAAFEAVMARPWLRFSGQALAYHALGRKKKSDAALADLITKHPNWAFQAAEVYAFRGETDLAFEWLERAYAQRDAGLTLMKSDPLLKNLERDPRFAAFLKKMRLPV